MNKLVILGAIAMLAMMPAADPADAGGNGTRGAGKGRAQASTYQPTSLTRSSNANGNGRIYGSRPQSNGSVLRAAGTRARNGSLNGGSRSGPADWIDMAPSHFSTGRFFDVLVGSG